MNVFKFSISIKSKHSCSDIKQSVMNCYKEKSKHAETYKEFAERKWSEIKKEQIKTMYSEKAVISYNYLSKTHYYIVQIDEHDSIDQATYEVVVISSIEDISEALNYAFDDIKSKLTNFKLKLIDNKALLFIYVGEDIISNKIMIKSNVFSFSKFLYREIFRLSIMLLVTLLGLFLSFTSESSTVDNVCYSVIASCIFFIVSEILIKINFKKTIEIKDLTNWVEKHDILITDFDGLDDDYNAIQNPIT
ncbi:hypothetical protein J2Z44_001308 [Clostridium punense]|uniref:Uncharacterized protein n=1 Tax=Clostridium punense TaxID=1054297 RepID=A0ABS4K161_9CLOT|nr:MULTISPECIES: hypothetical protein [Clostridium]EQB89738.1 hypothetical protein M918_19250 [Clostridium sp. BL8]MBP2021512.1 hypothetical protein [Clostridium punense]